MIKSILKIIKNIIISVMVLYGYNLVISPFNLTIPINIFTVLILSITGTSGFIGLVLFYLINYR